MFDTQILQPFYEHVIGGIRGNYDRHTYHDAMKHAFEALAAQIERIVNPPRANVVQFQRPEIPAQEPV